MKNASIIVIMFSLLTGIIISCRENGKEPIEKIEPYIKKYTELIIQTDGYEFPNKPSDEALQEIKNILHLPRTIFELKTDFRKVAKIEINSKTGLRQHGYAEFPPILDFSPLIHVFKNGDLLFCGTVWDRKIEPRLFSSATQKMTIDPKIPSSFYQTDQRIFVDGQYINLEFDKAKYKWFYNYRNKEIVFEDYKKMPAIMKKSTSIRGPFFSDMAIITATQTIKYINIYSIDNGEDILILYYNWQTKDVKRMIALPGTDHYETFDHQVFDQQTIDSKNRIYFYFTMDMLKNYREKSISKLKGKLIGHIMIYDPENDILYNVHHPFMDAENKHERFMEYQYVLGEDENIYYQLVTDKSYYVYKIELFWNKPMEVVGYNPVFFEYHPKLKEAWDKLSDKDIN